MKQHTCILSIGASLLFTVLISSGAFAQDFSNRHARAGFTIGPSFTPGASMILESPENFKIKPIFAWRAGVHATYPLTEIISAGLEMGLDGRGTDQHVYNNADAYFDTHLLYFSFYPNFVLGGFNLGFNFGFPLSATQSSYNEKDVDLSETYDIPILTEGRIGAVIPLYDGDAGWVSLIVGAGYTFNELVDYPNQVDIFGDWKSFSAHLGARFEFLIPGTERK